jgi:hypothetical protein
LVFQIPGKDDAIMEMTRKDKEIRALKIYVETGVYTINEVREKLAEPKVDHPEADTLLVLTEKAGWLHLNNTPVTVRVETLLPAAFANLEDAEPEKAS